MKIEYGLDRVAQASIKNSVKSRSDHVTVTTSDAAIMSLEKFFWEGAVEL